MSAGLIVILIITVYLALAAAAAPKLMRLVYRDNLAVIAEEEARWEAMQARYRKEGGPQPFRHSHHTELDALRTARLEGFWWSLVWPASLAFHALSGTAFKQEIAAQNAKANMKIIADYERIVAESFDRELAAASPPNPFRHIIKGWTTR